MKLIKFNPDGDYFKLIDEDTKTKLLNKVFHDWLDKHREQKEFINIEEVKE